MMAESGENAPVYSLLPYIKNDPIVKPLHIVEFGDRNPF